MLNLRERVEVEVLHRPTTGQLAVLLGLTPLQTEHARLATVGLCRALHWHRWFLPTEPNLRVMRWHASEAGRRAAWAGQLYIVWALLVPEALKVEPVWTAFRDGYFAQRDLDETADPELSDAIRAVVETV